MVMKKRKKQNKMQTYGWKNNECKKDEVHVDVDLDLDVDDDGYVDVYWLSIGAPLSLLYRQFRVYGWLHLDCK